MSEIVTGVTVNPPYPAWVIEGYDHADDSEIEASLSPMPGSMLRCGCHVRRPDYEAILCSRHLAELNREIVPGATER